MSLHRADPGRYPYLLESVAHQDGQARFSILFAYPGQTISCKPPQQPATFLQALQTAWHETSEVNPCDTGLPFTGGWFVYLGYETVTGIEPHLNLPVFPMPFPVAFATRCPAAVIVDHQRQQTILVSESDEPDRLSGMLDDIRRLPMTGSEPSPVEVEELTETAPDDYLQQVDRILDYIRAGDVFQVNLSRAWQARLAQTIDATDLYARLRQTNPAPFACLIRHADGDIISSSPERLVRISWHEQHGTRQRQVQTRPIAGTRPRSHDEKDSRWLQELRTDLKEQAEHIMLIDLERNDLGRVCEPGSIHVDELMTLESYAHVHHIVSNITGRLRPDVTPVDVLRAVFPGGTITGCPKVRCMEIIAELEGQGRGPYTGSVGYINRDGGMDFNILIRTLFQQGDRLYFRTGAGIVADSVPERELKETRHKAKGLLLALGHDPD